MTVLKIQKKDVYVSVHIRLYFEQVVVLVLVSATLLLEDKMHPENFSQGKYRMQKVLVILINTR